MEEIQMSAITDRFYLILQDCFNEDDARTLVADNYRRPVEKRLNFVASKMERITPEARDILKNNEIPVVFY